jgi:hypothetical protein
MEGHAFECSYTGKEDASDCLDIQMNSIDYIKRDQGCGWERALLQSVAEDVALKNLLQKKKQHDSSPFRLLMTHERHKMEPPQSVTA